MNVPVLLITYNRLEFTKKALRSLVDADFGDIHIYDNGSTDGTQHFLRQNIGEFKKDNSHAGSYFRLCCSEENKGIAAAMNWFLENTKDEEFVCKSDNDTLVPPDFCARMLPHMEHCDLCQARHPIIKATNPNGWEGFTKGMKRKGNLLFNTFIGGSGIMFKRKLVNHIPETEWALGGWRQFQREHPELIKTFASDVEIELLDSEDNGGYPAEYLDYYKATGRVHVNDLTKSNKEIKDIGDKPKTNYSC